jgi:hypothetical protein
MRRPVAKAGMRPDAVVVAAPWSDDDTGFRLGAKPLHRRSLLPQLTVEAFVRAVLPWLARLDVRCVDLGAGDSLRDGARDELRPTFRSNVLRRAVLADRPAQRFDDPCGANGAGYVDSEALPGVLVDDRQALQLLTIGTGAEDEVTGLGLVAHAGRQWPGTRSGHTLPRPLAGHLKPGFVQEPMAATSAVSAPRPSSRPHCEAPECSRYWGKSTYSLYAFHGVWCRRRTLTVIQVGFASTCRGLLPGAVRTQIPHFSARWRDARVEQRLERAECWMGA